jgi:hypothetical protein
VAQEGFTITELDLHDSGVWVTNQSRLLVGRFNYSAGQLDGAVIAGSAGFDVLQDGATVFIHDQTAGLLTQVNPAQLRAGAPVELAAGAQVALGGGRAAVFFPEDGLAWSMPGSALANFQPDAFDPVLTELPPNAALTVGVDGATHVVDPASASLITLQPTADGLSQVSATRSLKGLPRSGDFKLTAVGSTPVVWSVEAERLYLASGEAVAPPGAGGGLDPDDLALQQPSASADAVVYSTPDALVSQPLSGAAATTVEPPRTGGRPAAAVVLNGCAYAVWSQTAAFVRNCGGGGARSDAAIVETAKPRDDLRLRVNRDRVVLNQVNDGLTWLVTDDLQQVDNWDDVVPSDGSGDEEDEAKDETDDQVVLERSADNHPPTAVDDAYGVRPGRSTLLPVVENDLDEDGDLLTVSLRGAQPSIGRLATVYNSSVFQIDVPGDASGRSTFEYAVSDGRGGEDAARVDLEVHPMEVNQPPQAVRVSRIVVGASQRVTYNVLTDWRDPDGDDVFLRSATPPSSEDSVEVRPDGQVVFQDGGRSAGLKTVRLVVSDGRAEVEGELLVDVRPAANQPQARGDLMSGPVGADLEVKPLLNDYDPSGRTLRLVDVSEVAGLEVRRNFDAGLFTVKGSDPGTFYLTYTVTNGPSWAEGLVRVDLLPPAEDDALPLAVPDTVLLPKGQEVTAQVLSNDLNPFGWPLVVTAVTAPADGSVAAAIVDHETIRITEQRQFDSPITVNYQVSNGRGTAQSTITVVPVQPPEQILPPAAGDDEVQVRVGDVATVHVLANDTHPNGVALRLRPDLPETPDPDSEALVFTSSNTIRIHARQTPGTYTVLYQVEAVQGTAEPDTGRLTIQVIGLESERNQPPRPRDVQARTVAGSPVTIRVPLDGIDPDGDYVTLVGLAQAPNQGRISDVTATGFVFDPGSDTVGQAEFSYRVRDRQGATATARVTVGIAARSPENRPPIALADQIEVRPGRPVRAAVVTNDSDPDGDRVYLVAGSATSTDFEVTTEDDRLVFTAPEQEGDYSARYVIEDDFGQQATGVVAVTVRPDIPPKKPVPHDDLVPLVDVLAADSVVVDLLKNDDDPDGDVRQDDLAVADAAAQLDSGKVTLPVTEQLQIIDYSLTDPDGLVGTAFIMVPGTATAAPQLKPDVRPAEVKAGQSVALALSDYVLVGPGKSARVTEADKVWAWNGAPALDSATQVSFTAPVDYVGPAALSLEVTDGTGPDDPAGLTAVVTIPVTVLPGDRAPNQPPTMTGALVEVEAGGQTRLDLTPYVNDPDPDDEFEFDLAGRLTQTGLSASLDGSVLVVTAERDVAKSTRAVQSVAVSDGSNPAVSAEIEIRVVASREPLARAIDDLVDDAHQGRTECVPVLTNDVNPFPDQPLVVVSAQVETGQGTAQPGCGGVEITPAASFVGTMVVRYTVQDATGDPDRQVEGRVRLNVKGRPDPPTALHVDEVANRTVILGWQPSNNNGSPVTGYLVTGSPAYSKDCGTQTVCLLDGLTNDVAYTFTVTATNDVGVSDPSAASAEARPDAVPNRPQPPQVVFGDRSLSLSWADPGSPGSPVTSYDLEISPPPQSGNPRLTEVVGTAHTWSGLRNGTAYRIKICARNRAPGVCEQDGHWSEYSVEEIPAGPPAAPSQPTVTRLDPVGSQGQARVCWTKPSGNGDDNLSYVLRVSSGTTVPVATGTTCQAIVLATSQTDYSFTVAAVNKAGSGDHSPASADFRSVVAPGPVTGLIGQDQDSSCGISFTGAALNGARSGEVSYQWQANNGASGSFGASTQGTAGGLPNNGAYSIQVWAVTTVQGVTNSGPKTTVSNCQPYGLPNQPGVSANAEGSQQVRLHWSVPAANGRPLVEMQISVDSGGWEGVSLSNGSRLVGNAYSQAHYIRARVKDSVGQWRESGTAGAISSAPPSVTMTQDNANQFHLNWSNLQANSYGIMIYRNGQLWDRVHGDGSFCSAGSGSYHAGAVCPLRSTGSLNVGGMGNMPAGASVYVVIEGYPGGLQSNSITWWR